jgi:ActR/RegA family two-component response regulator
VLLVDDVPGEAVNFARVFGEQLTSARTLAELDDWLDSGQTWDLAFVDFNLSDASVTGLSAMLRLKQLRPQTKIVTYSQFAENGRVLFAAAARHWLGARAVLDKSQNHPQTLARYAATLAGGLDPSPVQWRNRLQRAALIDALLPDLAWIERWRALDRAAGDVGAAARLLNLKTSHLRGFKERGVLVVNQVNEAFFDLPNPGPSRNKKGILMTFVAQHNSFLTAPDLPVVLAYRDEGPAGR